MDADALAIEVRNQDGEVVKLGDYRGRKLVVFAFPKANTSGCTKQATGFRDRMPALEEAGAAVVGISPDQPAALQRWREKEDLPFDLLSDPDHVLLDALGVWGEKSMYGRTYMGVIRSHFVFDEDGELIDSAIKVSPTKSVEQATRSVRG